MTCHGFDAKWPLASNAVDDNGAASGGPADGRIHPISTTLALSIPSVPMRLTLRLNLWARVTFVLLVLGLWMIFAPRSLCADRTKPTISVSAAFGVNSWPNSFGTSSFRGVSFALTPTVTIGAFSFGLSGGYELLRAKNPEHIFRSDENVGVHCFPTAVSLSFDFGWERISPFVHFGVGIVQYYLRIGTEAIKNSKTCFAPCGVGLSMCEGAFMLDVTVSYLHFDFSDEKTNTTMSSSPDYVIKISTIVRIPT